MEVPNYMQMPGVARSLGATSGRSACAQDTGWEPDWDEFERAVTPRTRLLYLSNPNNPTGVGAVRDRRCGGSSSAASTTGTWLLADEVYLGAEIDRPRTTSFWGMSDRVIVTSGLSKAYGIPGVRIGWLVGPPTLVAACWTQHDYLTIGPNKMSDRIARVAVEPANRERCYARTRDILRHNLPIAREWVAGFGGRLTWREPQAGAIALVKYDAAARASTIAERVRTRQSTLIVPGSHVGLEGYLRIWLGGREEFLREGLRRIGAELERRCSTEAGLLTMARRCVVEGKESPFMLHRLSRFASPCRSACCCSLDSPFAAAAQRPATAARSPAIQAAEPRFWSQRAGCRGNTQRLRDASSSGCRPPWVA